jgi:hypothetical protein
LPSHYQNQTTLNFQITVSRKIKISFLQNYCYKLVCPSTMEEEGIAGNLSRMRKPNTTWSALITWGDVAQGRAERQVSKVLVPKGAVSDG